MRILISGASGVIGKRLVLALSTVGNEVVSLVRRAPAQGELPWDPEHAVLDGESAEGFDAVVHLAGENVGDGRWTDERKRRIEDSRVQGTSLLATTLARRSRKPRVLVSASAVGYYGGRGRVEDPVDETAPAGDDFLARVCVRWEQAAVAAADAGIRVVHPRFGVVLSADGGALHKMLTPFRAGLGGPIGGGKQPFPWVAIDDAILAIVRLISDESLAGPVNVVAPERSSQADFARALGRVLGRPAFVPLPRFAVKALFGEMGETVLLGGVAAVPRRLLDAGFGFSQGELYAALRHLLPSR